MVPIVEPEILMDGAHTLAQCEEVTRTVLECVFGALAEHRVVLETILLKTGMVLPGKDCLQQAGAGEVAEATLRCLRRGVPAAVPGIVFLSGGQSDMAATEISLMAPPSRPACVETFVLPTLAARRQRTRVRAR